MKKITNNNILKKSIISLLLVIVLANVICVPISRADTYGTLFSPIQSFLIGLGDALMYVANSIVGEGSGIIKIEHTLGEKVSANAELIVSSVTNPVQMVIVSNAIVANAVGIDVPYFDDIVKNMDWIDIPHFAASPEKIFSNQIPLLDIDIISPPENQKSIVGDLQKVVASWYNGFKNLAAVGLLTVLAYSAIRMIISSTAADKSKYKQMLMDWLVAFCLLFFMHYIMSFSITIVKSVAAALSQNCQYIVIDDLSISSLEDKGFKEALNNLDGKTMKALKSKEVDYTDSNGNTENRIAFTLTEYVRFRAQTGDGGLIDGSEKFAFTVMYLVMVIYTLMFLFVYIKRLVYLIFLTMFAPLVALTYPIDKIKDGSAQGFNTWLREYIFNLIIQPFHLLVYYTLVGSAIELATEYVIYPLVVLGFLLQAEKIMRNLFGFNKTQTAGSLLNGVAGGAMVMGAINRFGGFARKAIGGGGKGGDPAAKKDTIRTMDDSKFKAQGKWDTNNYLGEEPNPPKTSSNGGTGGNKGGNKTRTLDAGEQSYTTEGHLDTGYIPGGFFDTDQSSDVGKSTDSDLANVWQDDSGNIDMPDDDINMPDGPIDVRAGDAIELPNQGEMDIRTKDAIQMPDEGEYIDPQAFTGPKDMNGKSFSRDINDLNKPVDELKDDLDNEGRKEIKGSRLDAFKASMETFGIDENFGKNVAKGVLKVGAGAVGAATLGTVGLAAGLASDDFSNVAKYGAAAAGIGAFAGSKGAGKAIEMPQKLGNKITEAGDAAYKARYGKDEYQKRVNERINKQHFANKKIMKKYYEAFENKDEARKAMEAAKKMRNATGITDDEVLIKTMKAMKKQGYAYDDKKGFVVAKLSKHVDKPKDIEDIREQLIKKNRNRNEIAAVEQAIRSVKDWDY